MKERRTENILLSFEIFDSIVEGWFSVWFVKGFAAIVDVQYLSISNIIRAILGAILMFVVIKRFEKPTFKHIIFSWILSYFSLFALFLTPGYFLLISTILSVLMGSIVGAFRNSLYAINIPNERRARYDNHVMLLQRIGSIIGGSIAYLTILPHTSYQMIWICGYIAFDIDLIITLILIKKRVIAY